MVAYEILLRTKIPIFSCDAAGYLTAVVPSTTLLGSQTQQVQR